MAGLSLRSGLWMTQRLVSSAAETDELAASDAMPATVPARNSRLCKSRINQLLFGRDEFL